jgi:hypothetical protein
MQQKYNHSDSMTFVISKKEKIPEILLRLRSKNNKKNKIITKYYEAKMTFIEKNHTIFCIRKK